MNSSIKPEKKKILILSPFFHPELISTGKYNTQLALALEEAGAEVTVLCSYELYPFWKPNKNSESISNIKIIRGGSFIRYPKEPILRRLVLELWFFAFLLKESIKNKDKYDIIIPIFPPNLASLALPVFKSKYTKTIGIVHDIQTVMMEANNNKIRKIARKAISSIEQKSYNSCDNLIFLSVRMKNLADENFKLRKTKTFIHYPFVTIDKIDIEEIDTRNIDKIIAPDSTNIVYSGALGEKQQPYLLADLLAQVKKISPSIQTFIFSQGSIFEKLQKDPRFKEISFQSFVSEEELPILLKRSTVQIIPQDVNTSDGAFPSKLPNIIYSGSKVFCITARNSEIAEMLTPHPEALVLNTWEDRNAAEKLVEFAYKEKNMEKPESSTLIQKFSIKNIVNTILK